jgi:uncharacterized protein (DUF1810 family)
MPQHIGIVACSAEGAALCYRTSTRRTGGSLIHECFNDDLQRFVDAQDPVYAEVLDELAAARKRTHWMWFIFPQIKGLGQSAMARRYGVESIGEARAYWRHPVLGLRLKECTEHVLRASGKSAHDIFGSPDDLKLRSCMTLFAEAAGEEPLFRQVLERFFAGHPDPRTLALLQRQA